MVSGSKNLEAELVRLSGGEDAFRQLQVWSVTKHSRRPLQMHTATEAKTDGGREAEIQIAAQRKRDMARGAKGSAAGAYHVTLSDIH